MDTIFMVVPLFRVFPYFQPYQKKLLLKPGKNLIIVFYSVITNYFFVITKLFSLYTFETTSIQLFFYIKLKSYIR